MKESPEIRRLARRLLQQQREAGQGPAAAAESTTALLCRGVTPLVGSGGCRMLIARALRRATDRNPHLAGVTADNNGDRFLKGLQELGADVPDTDLEVACEDIVAELIGLLARFLGEDMALRLVQQTQRSDGEREKKNA